MTDLRTLGLRLAGVVWVALRSFAVTLFLLSLAGLVLAALSYYYLREEYWLAGSIAAVVAVIEGVTAGVVLGFKRGLAMAATHAVEKLRFGQALVRLVFERLLGVTTAEQMGERGSEILQVVERLPLAQVEQRLRDVIHHLTPEAEQGSWLRRKIQTRALESVGKYTLTRFREQGAKHGGVDLGLVKEELEQTIDSTLAAKVRGGLRLWTLGVILGLPFTVAIQTWIILLFLHAK